MQLFSQVDPVIDALPYLINPETLVNFTKNTKFNFTEFSYLFKNKSYIPITGCVLEHITTTPDLSNLEKLYHILINSLAFINNKTNSVGSKQRSCSLPSKAWARLLNCSRSQIFALQRSLEQKGYLLITRDKNSYTQNKRNLLTPALPDSVFKSLCKAPDKLRSEHLAYDSSYESKLEYLDRTKLFIPLNYDLLKIITSNEDLLPLQKVVWLDFYARCYKCHISSNKTFSFSFITSYEELMERYGCSRASLSKAMNILEGNNFIAKARFFCKKDYALEDRQDKSLWQITLSMPVSYNLELINIKNRYDIPTTPDYLEKSNNDIDTLPIFQTNESVRQQLSSDKIVSEKDIIDYCNNKTDDDYINNVLEEITDADTNNHIDINSLVNTDSMLIVGENDTDKTLNL